MRRSDQRNGRASCTNALVAWAYCITPLFEQARPGTIVLTTPNREYNVRWENVGADKLRHGDHRFEWTRVQFQEWAQEVAERYGYRVQFLPVGPEDGQVGAPTQMGVFSCE